MYLQPFCSGELGAEPRAFRGGPCIVGRDERRPRVVGDHPAPLLHQAGGHLAAHHPRPRQLGVLPQVRGPRIRRRKFQLFRTSCVILNFVILAFLVSIAIF